MCMPPLDIIGPQLLQTLRLMQELIFTALHGRAALKQNPPSADEETDKAVRWAMVSAPSTEQPVLTVMSLAYMGSSAFRKLLGHPLVHILLQEDVTFQEGKPPTSGNDTLGIPADFWLEDESVYKVRSEDVAQAMLVVLVANRQGASDNCNSESQDASCKPQLQILKALKLRGP